MQFLAGKTVCERFKLNISIQAKLEATTTTVYPVQKMSFLPGLAL